MLAATPASRHSFLRAHVVRVWPLSVVRTRSGLDKYPLGSESNPRLRAFKTFSLLAGHVRHLLSDGRSVDESALFRRTSSDALARRKATVSSLYLLCSERLRITDPGSAPPQMILITPTRHFVFSKSCAPEQSEQSISRMIHSSSANLCGQTDSGSGAGASFFEGPVSRCLIMSGTERSIHLLYQPS